VVTHSADTGSPEPPPTLTAREVGERLEVAPATVRRWASEGRIAAVRVGGRIRIHQAALERMVRPAAEEREP
jgi:excisionase family DNA binding protein